MTEEENDIINSRHEVRIQCQQQQQKHLDIANI